MKARFPPCCFHEYDATPMKMVKALQTTTEATGIFHDILLNRLKKPNQNNTIYYIFRSTFYVEIQYFKSTQSEMYRANRQVTAFCLRLRLKHVRPNKSTTSSACTTFP